MDTIPLPKPNADTLPFWTAAKEGRLIFQFCMACEQAQFYPRSICVHCGGPEMEWRESAGQGTVATFTEVQRAPTPAFKAMAPYVIALIDLDEGFRMMMNIVDSDHADIAIGSRTRTVFRQVEDITLPQAVLL